MPWLSPVRRDRVKRGAAARPGSRVKVQSDTAAAVDAPPGARYPEANFRMSIMPTTDHRLAAHEHVQSLISLLAAQPSPAAFGPLLEECQALARAIMAFHMEGIRFRMYNVERRLVRSDLPVPPEAAGLFEQARHALEAAGFHTRSHQAPT
jgi:hypothetical protein